MRLDHTASGVYVITPTPFHEDGALNLGDIPRMVAFFLERDVQGLTILGMMGEAMKLTEREALEVAEAVLDATADRVPVVAGVPATTGFATLRSFAARVMDAGAAGLMVAPPPHLRSDESILQHFEAVGAALNDAPFVLQDYPQGTGVHLTPMVIRRIIDAVPSFTLLKHEDWPGLAKLSWLRRASESGGMRRIPILTGNGGLFLADELRRGADGAMTGFAFPEMMRDVIKAHRAGDVDAAADVFDIYLPLMRYEQQTGLGLAVRKHILVQRGAISCSALRCPAVRLSSQDLADIAFLTARQERRLAALGRGV